MASSHAKRRAGVAWSACSAPSAARRDTSAHRQGPKPLWALRARVDFVKLMLQRVVPLFSSSRCGKCGTATSRHRAWPSAWLTRQSNSGCRKLRSSAPQLAPQSPPQSPQRGSGPQHAVKAIAQNRRSGHHFLTLAHGIHLTISPAMRACAAASCPASFPSWTCADPSSCDA